MPTITIVTPTYNQGGYLEEAVRSVLLQGYPNLQYVVVDDGSTDDTGKILRKYEPWLTVVRQENRGQKVAINRGLSIACGDVMAFLNSDDTYYPNTLIRAASAIHAGAGRHVVMGRCRFTDALGVPTGREHPSRFENHHRVLEVWKGHSIPQPAVFWAREVWRECGPIVDEDWVDYGLFCSFSRRYRFVEIDEWFATYRLHPDSKTVLTPRWERLAKCISISRRFWGPWWHPRHHRLYRSLLRAGAEDQDVRAAIAALTPEFPQATLRNSGRRLRS
jgi:glycosyltransferase involved in cell wall biosynthesis